MLQALIPIAFLVLLIANLEVYIERKEVKRKKEEGEKHENHTHK